MANKSVEAFRKLTLDMQRQVYNDAVTELDAQANNLVSRMRSVVVHGPTSALANSIRKQPGKIPTIVRVLAGGASTTHPATSGGRPAYDYARAVEFGTRHNPAQPFFFPTFRLMRKQMRSAMRRKITARIKKYSAG
jgi:HK97 gp10 family phage protein